MTRFVTFAATVSLILVALAPAIYTYASLA